MKCDHLGTLHQGLGGGRVTIFPLPDPEMNLHQAHLAFLNFFEIQNCPKKRLQVSPRKNLGYIGIS